MKLQNFLHFFLVAGVTFSISYPQKAEATAMALSPMCLATGPLTPGCVGLLGVTTLISGAMITHGIQKNLEASDQWSLNY